MLRRLRIKFVCINMAIVAVMLCAIFFLVLHSTRSSLEQQSIQMMESVALNGAYTDRPGAPFSQDVRLPFFALQFDRMGKLIGKSGGFFDLSDEQFLEELAQITASSGSKVGTLPEYSLRYYRTETPAGQIIVFADITSEEETIHALIGNCLLIGIISFLAFWGISMLLARWAVQPVEQAWKLQKQFTADASHELKTPLTVIMTNAELLQSGEYSEEHRQDFLRGIFAMSRQMRGLVEQLLEMARIDNGVGNGDMAVVDLSELALDAVMPFEPLFYEKKMTLECIVQDGITVRGHAAHLTQVVEILLDNARKYAYPHTTVVLKLTATDKRNCILSVQSQGDNLSPADLTNIFKRFYRLDKARAMNQSYGLGLAIAESITENHKGKIWASSTTGINTFYVQLPTQSKATPASE